jgi:hypothetical protein
MKLTFISIFLFILLPLGANAQGSAFWEVKTPTAGEIPAVHLVKEAEVLVANITIVASKRDPSEQAADFSKGLQALRAAVAKAPGLTIRDARTVLGGGEPNVYFSSISTGRLDTNRTASDLKILHPIGAQIDSLTAANVLRDLIGTLKLPRDVAIRIDSFALEVNDPDSLRIELLETIAKDNVKLQTIFKDSAMVIGGLENRVEQRPLSNHQVTIFIPYTLRFDGRKP